MNEENEQKHENEHDSMIDLEVTNEHAEQTRAGSGEFGKPEYKYVPVRP
jgi:hypothetical protein